MGTPHLTASTQRTRPVDYWTICCVADSLQNRSFPGICSSNDEYPELDIWDAEGRSLRRIQATNPLVCTHGKTRKVL